LDQYRKATKKREAEIKAPAWARDRTGNANFSQQERGEGGRNNQGISNDRVVNRGIKRRGVEDQDHNSRKSYKQRGDQEK